MRQLISGAKNRENAVHMFSLKGDFDGNIPQNQPHNKWKDEFKLVVSFIYS